MRKRHVRDDSTEGIASQDQGDLDLDGFDLGEGERPRGYRVSGGPATPPPYLESIPKDCDPATLANLEVHPCKCKSWFCPQCCRFRGLTTRDRLIPVLESFTGLQMWTLTIDPKLFATPGLAFQFVREARCVARFVRRLHESGHLHSRRFFCVVEWQKISEMPHYHALLDTTFVPYDTACEIWNAFRPANAGPIEGKRPGFGAIRFSGKKNTFETALHAARYACKYLIKHPEHGYPAWVMSFTGQIHRYTISHRLWKSEEPTGNTESGERESDEPAEAKPKRKRVSKRRIRSIQDRIGECGESSVILHVTAPTNATESWVRQFVEKRCESVEKIAARLGRSPEKGRLSVSFAEWKKLQGILSTSWRKNDETRSDAAG